MEHRTDTERSRTVRGPVKRSAGSSPNVVVRSIAFTPAALEALEQLAAAIATRTGRKSSASAVVRALLRQAQEIPGVTDKLATLVEHELTNESLSWGKPPRGR
ncbi:MAG: hypothetical protein JWN44_6832 [Myxococcales bacterium]|nr:hypothetical protein [Myxococcales bacterium]